MITKKTIELDFDELEFVDEQTKVDSPIYCECGKIAERGGPDSLSGMSTSEWPCCRGKNWEYCSVTGDIVKHTKPRIDAT